MTNLSLKDMVTCAINSVEAGVETKEGAVSDILGYIDAHYTNNGSLEVLPVELFEVEGQKIIGIRFEDLLL